MKATTLNNVDITFQLLDGYLQQTEPLAPDKTLRTRLCMRIALELVRDVLISRRDSGIASVLYEVVSQELSGFPELTVDTFPECGVACAVQRLLLPYRTV